MTVSSSFYQRNEKWILLLLVLLSYPLFFHKLGDRDIWSPDEDEYVQVNREMVYEGHWIYPTANGKPYYIKPPLFNWLGSAFAVLNGEVTEYTSRLPSAIAATMGILLVYFFGKLLFGYRAALLSALVIGTTPIYIEFGRWIQINMMSTVLLVASLVLFYWGYTNKRKRTLAYLLMYVFAGFGTLNMGLVNLAMPILVISMYLIVVKDFKHFLRLKIGWGNLIYLFIVAPWYVIVSLEGEHVRGLFILSNFTRYFNEWVHVRPFYYYLTTTPPYFLPWVVYLPAAIYLCFSKKAEAERKQLLFPSVWIVSLFLFFSMSQAKRSEYLLPIFPAMALLAGYVIDRGFLEKNDSNIRQHLFIWPTYFLFGIMTAAGLGIAIYGAILSMGWFLTVLPTALILLIGTIIAFLLFRRNYPFPSLMVVVLILVLSVAYSVGPVVAKKNANDSAKPFCLKVVRYLQPGEKLKTYRFYKPVFGVYTQRLMDETDDPVVLEAWLRSEKPVYVVTKEKEYLKIKDNFPAQLHIVIREWIDHRYVLLLSNRPVHGL